MDYELMFQCFSVSAIAYLSLFCIVTFVIGKIEEWKESRGDSEIGKLKLDCASLHLRIDALEKEQRKAVTQKSIVGVRKSVKKLEDGFAKTNQPGASTDRLVLDRLTWLENKCNSIAFAMNEN